MVQFRGKNSRRKVGLMPGHTPTFHPQPTAEATIPMWQNDGSVKYVTPEDFKWLAQLGLVEHPTTGST